MTKSEFLANTAPIQVAVGGVPQTLTPRKFSVDKPESERSVGFFYSGKIPLPAGTKVVPLDIAGFPLGASPTKPKEGKKNGFYGSGKVTIGGLKYQVGANITDLGDGRGNVSVNVIAVKSKEWPAGEAAAAPPAQTKPRPAPATAALAAPTVPALRSMTRDEAMAEFARASGLPLDSLEKKKGVAKTLNDFAKRNHITIVA